MVFFFLVVFKVNAEPFRIKLAYGNRFLKNENGILALSVKNMSDVFEAWTLNKEKDVKMNDEEKDVKMKESGGEMNSNLKMKKEQMTIKETISMTKKVKSDEKDFIEKEDNEDFDTSENENLSISDDVKNQNIDFGNLKEIKASILKNAGVSKIENIKPRKNSFFSDLIGNFIKKQTDNLENQTEKLNESKPSNQSENLILFKLHQHRYMALDKIRDLYLTIKDDKLVVSPPDSTLEQIFKLSYLSKGIFHIVSHNECLEYDEINQYFIKNTCNDLNKYQLFQIEPLESKSAISWMMFGTRGSFRTPNPLYHTGYNPVLHGFHGPRGKASFPSALFV